MINRFLIPVDGGFEFPVVVFVDLSGDFLFDEVEFVVDDLFHGGVVGRLMQLFGGNVNFAFDVLRRAGDGVDVQLLVDELVG
jgi:hypothetical protein